MTDSDRKYIEALARAEHEADRDARDDEAAVLMSEDDQDITDQWEMVCVQVIALEACGEHAEAKRLLARFFDGLGGNDHGSD